MGHGFNRDDQLTAAVGMPEATDTGRRVHNAIRYGVVIKTDYAKGLVRVGMQEAEDGTHEIETDWIPWVTQRAGQDRFWWAPEADEVVMVISPSGEMSNGFALPAAFSNQNQDGGKPGLMRFRFWDNALIEYDRDDHHLVVDMAELRDEAGGVPEPIIHVQTGGCKVQIGDDAGGVGLIRMESTGNIELYAAGEVRIVSGAPVEGNQQLVEAPETIEPRDVNEASEEGGESVVAEPLEVDRIPPEGSSVFIELNP